MYRLYRLYISIVYMYIVTLITLGFHLCVFYIASIYCSLHTGKAYDINNLFNEIAEQMFDS